MTLPIFSQLDMTWLSTVPWLAAAIGWSVLLIEGAYPIFMGWKKTRSFWLLLVVGMHFGIGLSMGMWLFASIMIILSLAAYGDTSLTILSELLSRVRASVGGFSSHRQPQPTQG